MSKKVPAFLVTGTVVFVLVYVCVHALVDGASAVGDAPAEADSVKPSLIAGSVALAFYGALFFSIAWLLNRMREPKQKESLKQE